MANERRLIDAEALIVELRKSAEYHETRRLGYFSAIDHIREQPTVDAVEVVRCRDCCFAHRVDGPREKYSCAKGSYCTPWFNGDDFCSYGERRCE